MSATPIRLSRHADRRPEVSFEFFPARDEASESALWHAVEKLAPLQPRFLSVTYGAGGSTRARTHLTATRAQSRTGVSVAAHLTCVGATRAEVNEVARGYWRDGIRHIVALRGDPRDGIGGTYVPHPAGYAYAADLVMGLRHIGDFEISVAAFPEGHPESRSPGDDVRALLAKQAAGATRAITQFFFDNDAYLRFLDRARSAGVTIPIVPGIMPIHHFSQVAGFARRAGATVPAWIECRFAGLDDDPETSRLVGAAVAAEQAVDLIDRGIDEIHFYTLNRPELVRAVCHVLGVRPALAVAA